MKKPFENENTFFGNQNKDSVRSINSKGDTSVSISSRNKNSGAVNNSTDNRIKNTHSNKPTTTVSFSKEQEEYLNKWDDALGCYEKLKTYINPYAKSEQFNPLGMAKKMLLNLSYEPQWNSKQKETLDILRKHILNNEHYDKNSIEKSKPCTLDSIRECIKLYPDIASYGYNGETRWSLLVRLVTNDQYESLVREHIQLKMDESENSSRVVFNMTF